MNVSRNIGIALTVAKNIKISSKYSPILCEPYTFSDGYTAQIHTRADKFDLPKRLTKVRIKL